MISTNPSSAQVPGKTGVISLCGEADLCMKWVGIIAACIYRFTAVIGMTLRENILAGIAIGEAEGWMGTDSKQTCHSKESSLWPGRRRSRDTVRLWASVGMGRSTLDNYTEKRTLGKKKDSEQQVPILVTFYVQNLNEEL